MTKPENDGIPFELLCQQEYTFTQKLFLFNNGSVNYNIEYKDVCTDEYLVKIVAHSRYFERFYASANGVRETFILHILNNTNFI